MDARNRRVIHGSVEGMAGGLGQAWGSSCRVAKRRPVSRRERCLRARADAAQPWHKHGFRRSV